jgi:DNA-binding transcriptional ArsR family regulator
LTCRITYNQMVVDELSEEHADRVFHAMAAGVRRDILVQAMQQEQSVSSLARRYEMSFAAVHKHVTVLEAADLVRKRRRGREQIVQAHTTTLRAAAELLGRYEQVWIARAAQMAELIAEDNEGGTER